MPETRMLGDQLAAYLDHWRRLKGERPVPTLADFLDKPVPRFQPWLAIIDASEDVVVRLLGTALADFYGADFTGKPAAAVYQADGFGPLRRMNLVAAKFLCGGFAVSSGETSTGRVAEIMALGLPLQRKGGISVAWLVEPAVTMGLGETGVPMRRLVYEQWIDLGNGLPE